MSAPSEQVFEVAVNQRISRGTYRLELLGNTVGLTTPGQFVNVEVPGFYLRRPLSIYLVGEGRLELIYKVLGEGTEVLTEVAPGTKLRVLSGLGNGFTIHDHVSRPLVIGGGVGVVPLLYLVQELVAAGQKPQVVLGFGSADEVFMVDELEDLGVPVTVTTADGTEGVKGFVTDALPQIEPADYFYTCGPTPMLQALTAVTDLPGQFSLEERMACGFGACVGCVVQTRDGVQRVCKEGPVFTREELQW